MPISSVRRLLFYDVGLFLGNEPILTNFNDMDNKFVFLIKQTSVNENGYYKMCLDLNLILDLKVDQSYALNKTEGADMAEVFHEDGHMCFFFSSTNIGPEQARKNIMNFVIQMFRDFPPLTKDSNIILHEDDLKEEKVFDANENDIQENDGNKIKRMQSRLDKLVKNEQYEEAALLRDSLRKLKNAKKNKKEK